MKKLIGVIGIMVALLLTLNPVLPVMGADVDTKLQVGGGGSSGPFICAKFETPDHSTDNGTQILPVAEQQRMVKFYVVLGDPNGVDDIAAADVTVLYDNGTEKFQLRAIRQPDNVTWKDPAGNVIRRVFYTDNVDMDANCSASDPVDLPVPNAMATLHAQGRITFGVSQTLTSVLYDLQHGKQIMLELVGYMDYHQPSMWYTVKAMGTDKGGTSGIPLVNQFFYLSIVALKIDFSLIDWGTVNISQWNYVLGDNSMTTPARPTVQNVGNDPAKLELHATKLTGATYGKTIEDFDAEMDQLDPTKGPIQHGRIVFKASVPTIITEDPALGDPTKAVLLPPCTPIQIDFSVHPPTGTVSDNYTGKMTLTIKHY